MVVVCEDGNECRCSLDEVPAGSVGDQCRSFHPLPLADSQTSEDARMIGMTLSLLATDCGVFTFFDHSKELRLQVVSKYLEHGTSVE
jgi:hypothetical protein